MSQHPALRYLAYAKENKVFVKSAIADLEVVEVHLDQLIYENQEMSATLRHEVTESDLLP